MQFVRIDDDSGDGFNPRIDLNSAELGSYLVVLRTFGRERRYQGRTRVLVTQKT